MKRLCLNFSVIILAALLIMPLGSAYAYDGSDKLSDGSSSVFSPGYINAAKQKTEAVIAQLDPKKSFMERLVENIKNGVSGNVDKTADTKVTADIKNKTSNISGKTVDTQTTQWDPNNGAVNIGTGTAIIDGSGNTIGELVESQRYIFAGFSVGSQTISGALASAQAGDIVLARGGTYYEEITLKDGVSIFGSYMENGERDFTNRTKIWGIVANQWEEDIGGCRSNIEINGFDTQYIKINWGQNITIKNNNIDGFAYFSSRDFMSSFENINGLIIDNNNFTYTDPNLVPDLFMGQVMINSCTGLITSNTFTNCGPRTGYSGYAMYFSGNNYMAPIAMWIGSEGFLSDNDYYKDGFTDMPPGSTVWDFSITNMATSVNAPVSGPTLPLLTITTATSSATTLVNPYIYDKNSYSSLYRNAFTTYSAQEYKNATAEIFRILLSNKNVLDAKMGGSLDEAAIGRLITETLNVSVGAPNLTAMGFGTSETQITLALANILKNPTEDQKLLIDAITSLLLDMSKIEGEAGKSDELTKAENDLLQMVAAVLLAQGIPDLFKEGDVENMKGMFKDLGASKDKVLLEYRDSIRPYYNNIAKEIAANIAVLEIKGIVNKKLSEEELRKMEPREIDRILKKIRENNDKSFELQYILQQDLKYRKEYLEPSKKLMEDSMRNILGNFTKSLSEALEEKK
jgi:hypothetical protein